MRKAIKKAKKGFTLVELVVVIAIVAILGAVSIVGYFAFVDKAKESNDITLIDQLNTALVAEEAADGRKNITMGEAIEDVKENGIDLETLKLSKEGHQLLWNQDNDTFVLVEGEKVVRAKEGTTLDKKINLWKISDTVTESEQYSIYLNKNYAGTPDIVTKVGVDTGNNATVTSIKYTGGAGARIRTNDQKTNVTVDSGTAEIVWTGVANNINVDQASHNSVTVMGKVFGNLTLKKGHVKVEAGATVNNIIVDQTAGNEERITINGGKVTTVISNSTGFVKDNITGSVNTFFNKTDSSNNGKKVLTDKGVGYLSLEDALNASKYDGAVITLLDNIELGVKELEIRNKTTLNLNGYKITATGANDETHKRYSPFLVYNDFKFLNGTYESSVRSFNIVKGKFLLDNATVNETINSGRGGVRIFGPATAVIGKGAVIDSQDAGIVLGSEGRWPSAMNESAGHNDVSTTIDVYGKVIARKVQNSDGNYFSFGAITGNGNDVDANHTLNIYDGAHIEGEAGVAIYYPQPGTINMYGGLICGTSGIGIKAGTLNIKGGEIHSTGTCEKLTPDSYSSGINDNGSCIQVESHKNYQGKIVVSIENAKLTADHGYILCESVSNGLTKTKISSMRFADNNTLSITNDAHIVCSLQKSQIDVPEDVKVYTFEITAK